MIQTTSSSSPTTSSGGITDRTPKAIAPRTGPSGRKGLVSWAEVWLRRQGRGGDDGAVKLERLTERQREILALVAAGRTNAQIGLALGISVGTVRKHLEHVLRRLELTTRTAAAVLFITASAAGVGERWTASEPGLLAGR